MKQPLLSIKHKGGGESGGAFDDAVRLLDPGQLRRALYQAVKRTTREGRTDARDELGDRVNLTKRGIDQVIGMRLDTRDPLPPVGTITVNPKGVKLIEYRPRASKRNGVTAIINKRGGTPLKFRHGFKANLRSGHQGVFVRRRMAVFTAQTAVQDLVKAGFPEWEARQVFSGPDGAKAFFGKGIRHQKRLAAGGNFPNVTPHGIAGRLPIQELRGPSVVSFAARPEVGTAIELRLDERMRKNLRSQIDRFTKK